MTLSDRINAILDREDAQAFWLRSALVAFSMLFMWPRMTWILLTNAVLWFREDGPAAIGRVLAWVLAPFFFWAAPLMVWFAHKHRSKPDESDL